MKIFNVNINFYVHEESIRKQKTQKIFARINAKSVDFARAGLVTGNGDPSEWLFRLLLLFRMYCVFALLVLLLQSPRRFARRFRIPELLHVPKAVDASLGAPRLFHLFE
jgi:hypothetical protein